MKKSWKIFWTLVSSAMVLLLAIFFIWYLVWFNKKPSTVPTNTYLNQINISNYSQSDLKDLLFELEYQLRTQGFLFKNDNNTIVFPLNLSALSPDIPGSDLKYADSVVIDIDHTIEQLFSNKNNTFFNYFISKITKKNNYLKIYYHYDINIISEWLKINFSHLTINPEPAYFSWEEIDGQKVLVNNQEKIGKEINIIEIEKEINEILGSLKNHDIIIKTKSTYPLVKKDDLEPLRNSVINLLPDNGFKILYKNLIDNNSSFVVIEKDIITTWVSVAGTKNNLEISFDLKKIENFLENEIKPKVYKDVVLPKFEIINNKVSSWQSGENGQTINIIESAKKINNSLLNKELEMNLDVEILNVSDLNIEDDFKIKELIGTGHSNFAGSPANRRHNIKVGAESLNGLLIKPGEEFSLIKYLGAIDDSSGYLPELVIKDGKTIPEYGGGLCQVATSIFRSALGTGLPITARRNHSYRVSYYEPAGTDAAIYDPWPDVKFINDTNNYILIQSRIEGDNLHFDFWGTSDGRIATTTKPVIYNIVKPPSTKFIETDELKLGEKKCTEKAHNGADAYFDYIVTYPEGATSTLKQEVRFKSHYVPWQEVCLIGKEVEKNSSPELDTLELDSINNNSKPDTIETEKLPI